ncbi:molecular chaperone TorD [uncultured Cohaesibacter sp.]|uniref:molecular chaperone TorD n=1 Tax=uncultured Cohaesibacter sp. TaxID=1002546 RepID=UPI00292EE131|nr:molecular chaperone TorD [uncultured Cohaesibacter sp.]
MSDSAPRSAEMPDAEAMLPGKRELVYNWLADLFARELSADMLSHYQGEEGKAFLAIMKEEASLEPLVTHFESLLSQANTLQQLHLDLAGDFSRLFHGVAGRHSAPPYQSAHMGEGSRLYQAPVSDMNALLRCLEMSLPDDFHEPSDHVSVELSVMARLVALGDEKRQSAFLQSQLASWLPSFSHAVMQGDRHGFYSHAAKALLAWLKEDAASFKTL